MPILVDSRLVKAVSCSCFAGIKVPVVTHMQQVIHQNKCSARP
uniref:Uncharacterized protein n=1 Tax=Anguilla anguilla TaxID=7936 RepID=A0A0E9TSC2_ANGAN